MWKLVLTLEVWRNTNDIRLLFMWEGHTLALLTHNMATKNSQINKKTKFQSAGWTLLKSVHILKRGQTTTE